jgi:hypothetical protein
MNFKGDKLPTKSMQCYLEALLSHIRKAFKPCYALPICISVEGTQTPNMIDAQVCDSGYLEYTICKNINYMLPTMTRPRDFGLVPDVISLSLSRRSHEEENLAFSLRNKLGSISLTSSQEEPSHLVESSLRIDQAYRTSSIINLVEYRRATQTMCMLPATNTRP